jgi:hypothetical protein
VVDHNATCNLGTTALTAKHAISIVADGPITGGNITLLPASSANGTNTYGQYGAIYIKSNNGSIALGSIKSTPVTISGGGDIVIIAGTTLKTTTITTSLGAYVDLQVQQSSGNALFTVGTSGTNGVGKITTSGNNLTGQDPSYNYLTMDSAVVSVVNGTANSTGGISVISGGISAASGGGSRGVGVILNAQKGPLNIAGTISVAGTGNIGGGSISLLAQDVTFTGTATLNANGAALSTFDNQIVISASTIKYATLTLESDGNGVPAQTGIPQPLPSAVFLESQNQLAVTDTQDFDLQGRLIKLRIDVKPTNNPLSSLTLTGTGALTVHASGNLAQVVALGYPLAFNGGTTMALTSTGSVNHGVYINNRAVNNATGITISKSGAVTINASALVKAPQTTASGGYVYINGDNTALNAPTFVITANGPTTGAGDGGIIDIESPLLTTGATFKGAKLSANAASASTGNAQTGLVVPALDPMRQFPAINIAAGAQSSLVFGNGTTLGTFNLSANGGKTAGNAGKVVVNAGNMVVQNILAISAYSLSTTGNGGDVQIIDQSANPSVNFTFSTAPVAAIKAIGGTNSGMGGKVLVNKAFSDTAGQAINVNADIKVDGGSTLDTSEFEGSISLSGILCQQWKTATGSTTFPNTFWDCVTPTSPNRAPAAAAASLETGLKTLLGKTKSTANPSVQIYNMGIYTDYQTFFGLPVSQKRGIYGVSLTSIRISVAFQNVYSVVDGSVKSAASVSGSPTIMAGSIVHELGHQLDFIWGNLSQAPAFYNLRAPDFTFMDTDPNTGMARPCTQVFDNSICQNYVGKTNSFIFVTEFPSNANGTNPPDHNGDAEVFVEIFEHLESVRNGTFSVDPFLEQPLGFLPQESAYVQNLINHPPAAKN